MIASGTALPWAAQTHVHLLDDATEDRRAVAIFRLDGRTIQVFGEFS
jgi:hypothetical protein